MLGGDEILYPFAWALAFKKVSLYGTCSRSVWVCWADFLCFCAVLTIHVHQTHIPLPPSDLGMLGLTLMVPENLGGT